MYLFSGSPISIAFIPIAILAGAAFYRWYVQKYKHKEGERLLDKEKPKRIYTGTNLERE
jgi:hypothetical protein